MSDETEKRTAAAPREQRVYVLRSLDQARILADALRVRILEAYGREARTTKQLAEILGEKPSKLYHHVDALEKVELIRLEKTRQNRGTLEKYYRPVADVFKADPSLFTSDEAGDRDETLEELISIVLDGAAEELRELARRGQGHPEEEWTLTRMHVKGSARRIAEIRDRLSAVLDMVPDADDESDPEPDEPTWGCVIAFYPLAEPKKNE